jgi:hypothetical protein
LILKLKDFKNDTLVNSYLAYCVYSSIKDIESFEIHRYKTNKFPNVYSIFFYYNNTFRYARVVLILKNKKWLIDKIGHIEFL